MRQGMIAATTLTIAGLGGVVWQDLGDRLNLLDSLRPGGVLSDIVVASTTCPARTMRVVSLKMG
jgi:hypothetical protein